MKSKIRVDFKGLEGAGPQAFEPVIRIELQDSEDVRDGLLKAFFEKLGHMSNWLVVDIQSANIAGEPSYITITPLESSKFEETIQVLKNRLGHSTINPLPAHCQLGEPINYIVDAQEYNGKVVAIKFTEGKVLYDVIDDITSKIERGLPSDFINKKL